jgi:hypothetical protein
MGDLIIFVGVKAVGVNMLHIPYLGGVNGLSAPEGQSFFIK